MKFTQRLVVVSLTFLFFVSSTVVVFSAPVDCASLTPPMENKGGVCVPTKTSTGLSDTPIMDITKNLMNWLLAIFGFIAIIGFVISGVQYLTSAGDDGQAETAKRNMKYSIIGVIVALSGWVIIQAIDKALNATAQF